MPKKKEKIRWWRGYEVIALVVLIWYVVIALWLDMIAGSHASGDTVPGNPIVAVSDLAAGHVDWPGGYADVMVAAEVGILAVLFWMARRTLIARAKRRQQEH